MDIQEKYLSPEQVAEQLCVKAPQVRKLLREKKIPGVKFGKLWKIRQADLDEYLKQQQNV